MKKFLLLTLLAGVFTLMSTTSADAQRFGNRTNCPMTMVAAYGFPGCNVIGFTPVTNVPPVSVVNVLLPAGAIFLYAKGKYTGVTGCAFYVGLPACANYPTAVGVVCPASPCGDYKARIISGWGVVAYN